MKEGKKDQHLAKDYHFDHQMFLSKSKYWYSNNCFHFLKRALPFVLAPLPTKLHKSKHEFN
jgi:hypothetical protein